MKGRLLDLVNHLRCADQVLYDLQNVPPNLQPAAIVLHDTTDALDDLHSELDEWSVQQARRPRLPHDAILTSAAIRPERPDASTTDGACFDDLPEAVKAYLDEQQTRAMQLESLLEMLDRSIDEDNGVLTIATRAAHDLNEALDRVEIRKALRRVAEEGDGTDSEPVGGAS